MAWVLVYTGHSLFALFEGLATGVAAATVALAALGQTDRIGAALQSAARSLAHTTDSIGGALQGLAEEANNVRHFY